MIGVRKNDVFENVKNVVGRWTYRIPCSFWRLLASTSAAALLSASCHREPAVASHWRHRQSRADSIPIRTSSRSSLWSCSGCRTRSISSWSRARTIRQVVSGCAPSSAHQRAGVQVRGRREHLCPRQQLELRDRVLRVTASSVSPPDLAALSQAQSPYHGQNLSPPPVPNHAEVDDSSDDGPLHIIYMGAAQRLSRTAPADPHGDPFSSTSSTSSSSSDRVKKKKKKS